MLPELSRDEILRYSRHLLIPEVGLEGQRKLKSSSALIIGTGGLGSPVSLYLAAAGIGRIGLVDYDVVDSSNLQRQVIHGTPDVGAPKVESAANAIHRLNPHVSVAMLGTRLTAANAMEIVAGYDIVADGSDNFGTRFLVNDACFFAGKTLVSAAVSEFDGQLATYKAGNRGDKPYPCYRCLFPEPPPRDAAPNCSETGILGAAAGVMGTLQALEVMKEIIGVGESLAGRLLIYDALAAQFRTVKVPRDPECRLCGTHPTIRDLSVHNPEERACEVG
jgi:adenylyltransferase/sulfurtransferase